MPDPDEFDQQLRKLTSGQAEPAKFTELSAAERARRSKSPPPPAKLSWRKARKARQLKRPLGGPDSKRSTPGGLKKGKPGAMYSPWPGRSAGSQGRRKVMAIVRTVGLLVAFAALLYGLHLLGFGPR